MIDPPGRALRRTDLARRSASSSTSSSAAAAGRACSRTSSRSRSCRRGADFQRVLVPMKLGPIGEEMVATAVALAEGARGERRTPSSSILVPLDLPLDAPMLDKEEQAAASLAEARLLGDENDVDVEPRHRPRPVDRPGDRRQAAGEVDADLIVLGSSPAGAASRPSSLPTVDYVLRNAPCEVLSSPSRRASWRRTLRLRCRSECGRHRLRPGRLLVAKLLAVGGLGRDRDRRERGGPGAARRELARRVRRRSRHGHRVLARGRHRGCRRRRRRHERRQHEHRHRPGREKRYGIDCVVVRVLDPARAEFYAQRGMHTVCPTQTAISLLADAVRACEVPPRRRPPDVRDRRRRRQGGRERRPLAAAHGPRGDADRAAPRPLRAARGGVRAPGAARRRDRAARARAGRHRPPAGPRRSRSPATTRTTSSSARSRARATTCRR